MLNCAEELILLALDDESGNFHRMTNVNFNLALVGALLMDLALRDRIDVDLNHIYVIDRNPTGDLFLDHILEILAEPETSGDTAKLVRFLYNSLEYLKDKLLTSLNEKGIIRVEESKILWLFKHRRYPVIDQREEEEVLTRIRKTVMTDVIPEPKDLALIALVNTCDLLDKIFSKEELQQYGERIEVLQRMDLIGHAVNKIIEEVQIMIASTFIT
ncbi:MAG: GPP34 family phosphoprotein [Candidatus Cloacimonadaceae bacterium]|nr:GPP34 family phosphoprotein [Candidatus Cloacimonadaceae bacterium]